MRKISASNAFAYVMSSAVLLIVFLCTAILIKYLIERLFA